MAYIFRTIHAYRTRSIAIPREQRKWFHQKSEVLLYQALTLQLIRLRHLVGNNGEVLDAIQELTRLAVQTATGDRSRLMLDIEGFRAGRKSELRKLAQEKADEAKTTGASIKLAPMNAFERKIIHDTIQELGLSSESDGEDPNRYVVIYPA